MVRSIFGKTARQCGRSLLGTDHRDTRHLEHLLYRSRKPVDREAMQSHLTCQTWEARSYFNQIRINSHVRQATPSGTIPTSRFFPNQGRTSISWRATRLNPQLPKIQPACRPIGNHNERVSMRASARIQPIRNSVANAEINIVASPNCSNEWAMEFKPEVHVTIVDVRSGAFRK